MYSEANMSKQFRDTMKVFCPDVSCNQIENEAQDSDADYTLMHQGRGAIVELKINKSRKRDTVKIKIRPGQRNKLKRELRLGNPAYLLIQSGEVALLIPGDRVDTFPASGSITWDQAMGIQCAKLYWPQKSGPGRLIRTVRDYLFR